MPYQKLKDTLLDLLKKDSRLTDEQGELRENLLREFADNYDSKLIELLMSNETTRQKFFISVGNALIFKHNDLKFFIDENKLDNSYTQFENKIGLRFGSRLLRETSDVVLNFPYKDCVLEGGQSTEEGTDTYFEFDVKQGDYVEQKAKRKEIFFNQILAKDEIDRLLEPKAFTNAKKYPNTLSPREKEPGDEALSFTRDENGTIKDNLIIKGNNLLALHSLKEQFRGKVKLIYIDPPYNTGKDGFKYNDNFSHSTWLVFMKNRLEIAYELLSDDGSIWISLDDNEIHYAKILLDQIFGRDNFVSTIIWNSKYTVSNDAKFISYQHENILFYAKNKNSFNIGLLDRTQEQNDSYKNPDNDPKGVWKATPLHAKSGKEENNYTITFPNNREWTPPKGRFPRYSQERLLQIYEEGGLYFNKNGGIDRKTYLSEVKQGVTAGSVWTYDDAGHTHANNEELASILGKGVFDNPKGTSLIKRICKVANATETDIILDYHAGSGTTAHAVLQLNKEDGGNRQFILVEQMDYAESITAARVQKVIEKENIDASFLYLELAQNNQTALEKIEKAEDFEELMTFFDEMYERFFLSYNLKIKEFKEKICQEGAFKNLPLERQKQIFGKMLDLNQLYVNRSDMHDARYGLNQNDITTTNEFYNL